MPALYLLPVLAVVAAVFAVLFAKKDKDFPAFCSNLLAFLFIVESGLASIYPYMLKSSVFPEYGIDIFEAASSHMTLGVMLGGALVFVPIVIIYQLWAYTLFREKITETEQVRILICLLSFFLSFVILDMKHRLNHKNQKSG